MIPPGLSVSRVSHTQHTILRPSTNDVTQTANQPTRPKPYMPFLEMQFAAQGRGSVAFNALSRLGLAGAGTVPPGHSGDTVAVQVGRHM